MDKSLMGTTVNNFKNIRLIYGFEEKLWQKLEKLNLNGVIVLVKILKGRCSYVNK